MNIIDKISKLIKNNGNNEILLKSLSSLSIRVLSYILGFGYVFIIARYFNVESQGQFSIVFTILSLIALFSKLGIVTSMVKWLSNYFYLNKLGEAKFFFYKVYKLVVVFSSFLSLFVFFFADFLAHGFFGKPALGLPIKIIAIAIPFFSSTEIIANFFRSQKQIAVFSFYTYASKFILPFIILFLYLLFFERQQSIIVPIYCYSIGIVITGIVAFLHAYLILKKVEEPSTEKISYKRVLKVSLPMLFSSSLVMLMWWSDTFILGVYRSEEEVGVYSVAVKLATMVSFIYSAVVSILLPNIARYYNNNESIKLNSNLQYSSRIILISTTPIMLILLFFPKFFLSIFGEIYKEGSIVLTLLLIAQFTNSLTGPVGPFLNMSGREKEQLYFISIALIINLSLSIFLVKDFGAEGVAFGSAAGMIVWNIMGALYIKINLGFQTWIKL